jgi:hypothetical protein
MPRYTVSDAAGNTIEDVTPNLLKRFLDDCGDYAELRRDDWPDRSVLARPTDGGWQIEIADAEQRLTAWTPNTDATLDVLRAWAEEDDWWQEAFSWRPIGN